MEKMKNNEQNMVADNELEQVADNELEQVAAGTLTFDRLHALLFGGHNEENTDQTTVSDESGAWGSW